MDPFDSGKPNPATHLRTDGASVPWTPREIRADRRRGVASGSSAVPFVVQAGPSVLMIEQSTSGWVLAELRFDRETCTFRDIRLASYSWPREAFGVLLTRVAAAEPDQETIARLSEEFAEWVGFGFSRSDQ